METNEKLALEMAIKYAKKFGFMSRSFFWDHFCTRSRATNFRYWQTFLDSGIFLPYREIKDSSEYFYLNLKAPMVANNPLESVGKRSPLYLYHDEKIMRFAIQLERAGFLNNLFTEQELRSNRTLALNLLGGDYSKLPDLVFDLNCPGQPFRVALEIETTRKANDKYYQCLLSYTGLKKLDLILYGADQLRITEALKAILARGVFDSVQKKSAFFSIPDFEKSGLESPLELNSNKIAIHQFFKNLIGIRTNRFDIARDKNETPVSSKSPTVEGLK